MERLSDSQFDAVLACFLVGAFSDGKVDSSMPDFVVIFLFMFKIITHNSSIVL